MFVEEGCLCSLFSFGTFGFIYILLIVLRSQTYVKCIYIIYELHENGPLGGPLHSEPYEKWFYY